jgi:hypothetical protein
VPPHLLAALHLELALLRQDARPRLRRLPAQRTRRAQLPVEPLGRRRQSSAVRAAAAAAAAAEAAAVGFGLRRLAAVARPHVDLLRFGRRLRAAVAAPEFVVVGVLQV